MEKGETIAQALHREVREETGIAICIKKFLGFTEKFFFYDPTAEAWQSYLFYYICSPLTEDLLSRDDAKDYEFICPEWVPWQELTAEHLQFDGELLLSYLKEHTKDFSA